MSKIFSYNERSRGARQLSRALGWKRLIHRNSKFRGYNNSWVLNWGSTEMEPHIRACRVINTPEAVDEVSNKLTFFRLMDGTGLTPEWSEDYERVRNQVSSDRTWVARLLRYCHNGAGMVLCSSMDDVPVAPLYVLYVKKKDEYRVHVFDGEAIDVQQKKRRLDVPDEEVDYRIRNYNNGFIYARENIQVPDQVVGNALECMNHTSLVFGAVDVIWNEKQQRAYVLEINSAPGLEGSTVDSYMNAIKNYVKKNE